MLKERKNIASPLNPVVTKEQPPLLPSLVRRGDLPLVPSLLRRGDGVVNWGQMTKVYNSSCEKSKRKMLRSNLPKAEVILWSRLKSKGLDGYKFRRQYSVGKFVIDFYCPRLKLAIEVDGDSHFSEESEVCDRER